MNTVENIEQKIEKTGQSLEDLQNFETLTPEQMCMQKGGQSKTKTAEADGYLYLAADIL